MQNWKRNENAITAINANVNFTEAQMVAVMAKPSVTLPPSDCRHAYIFNYISTPAASASLQLFFFSVGQCHPVYADISGSIKKKTEVKMKKKSVRVRLVVSILLEGHIYLSVKNTVNLFFTGQIQDLKSRKGWKLLIIGLPVSHLTIIMVTVPKIKNGYQQFSFY